jgi:cobalt/nickel transport protein
MARDSTGLKNRTFFLGGLGIALLVAIFLSPFASQDPDGLDRVAQDQKFDTKALEQPPAHHLPFFQVFEEYILRGVPQPVATPLAGFVGTLVTFGLTWGIGKWVVRQSSDSSEDQSS